MTARNPIRSAPCIKVPGVLNATLKAKSWKEQDKLKGTLEQRLREDMIRWKQFENYQLGFFRVINRELM